MNRAHAQPSCSCVMPAFNEATQLPRVVPEVIRALRPLFPRLELILVNDGSQDDTGRVAQALSAEWPELVLLDLSRNFGKEAALAAGLDAAQGDVVLLMDADGQHPSSLVAAMLARWRDGVDVVYTVRRARADQTRLQRWLTALFYRIVNQGAGVTIPPDAGDFRLMDRRVARALRQMPERHRFMKGLYAWVGFRAEAMAYEPLERVGGTSRFGLRGAMRLGLTGLLAFSAVPLRMVGGAGLLLALAALSYGLWVVLEYFWWGIQVPGYATLVVGLMFLSGIQLLAVGVLAEYVARIYDEVKQRPLYLVAERHGAGLSAPTQP